ncbi:MAG: helix-turn-helix domain-containing protein [Candidatus Woesearchaeota archaeon]
MEITDLKKIGLTEGEIKIYNALLELGETTRTALAKKSGISPSKIYDVCNRLLEKGIIASVKKQGIIHFSAADPHRLSDFLNKKAEEIEKEKQLVDQLLPMLMIKHKNTHEAVNIEVFQGWEGLQTAFLMLENSMSSKNESLVFGASVGKNALQGDLFFQKHQERVEKKGYKIRIIFNEDMRKRKQRYAYYINHKQHQIRFLHHNTFTELYVYKQHVLFLMLLEKPIAICVKSQEAVNSFKKFFETIWKQAKK